MLKKEQPIKKKSSTFCIGTKGKWLENNSGISKNPFMKGSSVNSFQRRCFEKKVQSGLFGVSCLLRATQGIISLGLLSLYLVIQALRGGCSSVLSEFGCNFCWQQTLVSCNAGFTNRKNAMICSSQTFCHNDAKPTVTTSKFCEGKFLIIQQANQDSSLPTGFKRDLDVSLTSYFSFL